MKLILMLLAVANWRWARASAERSKRLMDEADAAVDDAWRHHATAERLSQRAASLAT